MKKLIKFIVCFIILLNLSACESKNKVIKKEDNMYADYNEQTDVIFDENYEKTEYTSETLVYDYSEKDTGCNNKFFFAENDVDLKYCVRYDVSGYDNFGVTNLQILKLMVIGNGILYRLTFGEKDNLFGEINRNFFVTKDKIYRLICSEDEAMLLENEADIEKNSYIACQDIEIGQNWTEDQKGEHNYMDVDEDYRYSHFFYTNDYDDVKYYERLYWKDGNGLVYYLVGRDALADEREFIRICE